MWGLVPTEEYARRLKRWSKNHPSELKAMLDNLDDYLLTLQQGGASDKRHFGFMHAERKGVWAIDQKGGDRKLMESRLYTFPDRAAENLYLLTIGDKRSQRQDVLWCCRWVDDLRARTDEA